ncbi:quinone oxidoreductase PIG3 isoform X1 [Neoarius graeffei]|uniref:quinone oxidoreductase PIG3 isoform X1 n=2 Tax=Neoarius graeffei TaxID=443677 RepID=UPI00298CE716|nr:quinone oxidoreductase PIG3 isoform X1 [Neoarius graeffei]
MFLTFYVQIEILFPYPVLLHLPEVMLQHLDEDTTMQAVCFKEPGGPEKLYLGRVPKPEPKDGEVLIKVYATALNRADVLQRRGLYPAPPGASEILGLEAAGVITGFGPGLQRNFNLGDKVMALLSGGGYAQYVAVPEELLMPVPSHLTLYEAAAIPEAWLTAYQLLHLIAQVKEGESVLIHAGASGVGTAAIQLAYLFCAIPLVTAGSPDKLKLAEKLGAAAGFNYKEGDFSDQVLQFTQGRGVDIILDCIGGSYWEKNVHSLAMDGRWVLYGVMGGKAVDGDLLGKLLFKRGHILSSLLRSRNLQYKAELVRSFTEQVLPHFQSTDLLTSLRPIIDTVFNMEDITEAHRHMEANKNTGKIIIKVSET